VSKDPEEVFSTTKILILHYYLITRKKDNVAAPLDMIVLAAIGPEVSRRSALPIW